MKNTSSKINNIIIAKMIKCIIISLLLKLMLVLLSAYIISSTDLNPNHIRIFWYGISLISGVVSGFSAGRAFGKRGLLWGAAIGIIGALLQIIVLFIMSDFNFNPYLFIILPCEVITGAIGGIISTNLKQ